MPARHYQIDSRPTNVYIIPTESLGSRYLRLLLRRNDGIRVLPEEELNTQNEKLKKRSAVILLNLAALEMPLGRYLTTLRTRLPGRHILAVSKPVPVSEQCRLLFLGVDGILSSSEVERHLGKAIRSLVRNQPWAAPEVLAEYMNYSRSVQLKQKVTLTAREELILRLLERSLSNKEIAAALKISKSTVKFHLANLFEKLGVDNRHSAVDYARSFVGACSVEPPRSQQNFEACDNRFVERQQQGFTVFFTGLSGSGKSTLANVLRDRLLEAGGRRVTSLDGDEVRKHLSPDLGFSKKDRNNNIRRIGYVASEITKNGGIALCAVIAPYDSVRKEVRAMIQPLGGFVLVYMSTPLATCEARSRKGLYEKARAGLIRNFTGINDPYEPPADASIVIDAKQISPQNAAQKILSHLMREGYIRPNGKAHLPSAKKIDLVNQLGEVPEFWHHQRT